MTSDIHSEGVQQLNLAIAGFLAANEEPAVSVSRVVNPLLDIWALAKEIDPEVAVPVERLLTALLGRALTTPTELAATMDEVAAALLDSTVPAGV